MNFEVTTAGWLVILTILTIMTTTVALVAIFTHNSWWALTIRLIIGVTAIGALTCLGYTGQYNSDVLMDNAEHDNYGSFSDDIRLLSGNIGLLASIAYAMALVIAILMIAYATKQIIEWKNAKRNVVSNLKAEPTNLRLTGTD